MNWVDVDKLCECIWWWWWWCKVLYKKYLVKDILTWWTFLVKSIYTYVCKIRREYLLFLLFVLFIKYLLMLLFRIISFSERCIEKMICRINRRKRNAYFKPTSFLIDLIGLLKYQMKINVVFASLWIQSIFTWREKC